MKKRCIITISRQYGSAGRGIGKKLADDLGINCYDKELITLAAERGGIAEGNVQEIADSQLLGSILNMNFNANHGFTSTGLYDTPTTEAMFETQSEIIRGLADIESCVIIGRAADYVLRERTDVVSVFVRAVYAQRVRHAIEEYDLPRKDAESHVRKADKSRESYYKSFTDRAWGDPANFDLVVSSTLPGEDGSVEIIKTLLRVRDFID